MRTALSNDNQNAPSYYKGQQVMKIRTNMSLQTILMMKSTAILISLLFILSFCGNKQLSVQQKEENFYEAGNNVYSNRFKIIYQSDSAIGEFYGVEMLSDNSPVFYKAKLEKLELSETQIQFELKDYLFISKPFTDETVEKDHNWPKEGLLPGIIKFPQQFSGTKTTDGFEMIRTSVLYDSKFDKINFIKKR
jgi:hypothetical protein